MNVILLICALLCAVIATLTGFGWIDSEHILGWLSASVFFLVAASLVGYVPWPNRG